MQLQLGGNLREAQNSLGGLYISSGLGTSWISQEELEEVDVGEKVDYGWMDGVKV